MPEATGREAGDSLAMRRRHTVRALPHLQIRLGAVEHVGNHLTAAGPPELLEPVGVEAVVREALLVEVEGPLAPNLARELDPTVEGLERVFDRRCGRSGLRPEAVHVRAPPEAERV